MTRVNVIPPEELTDQWLMAEYREITHVLNLVERHQHKSHKIPEHYTFGNGHVKFFYDKLSYIESRYFKIKGELLKRNFNIEGKDDKVLNYRLTIDPKYYNDWSPNSEDYKVNVGRLIFRFCQKPNWYKFKGTNLNNNYIKLLESYF